MTAGLPHDGVYARVGVSRIAGVGVLAIVGIPAGTNIFGNDRLNINWVNAKAIEALPEGSPEKSLYVEFGIRKNDQIGCPTNFNLLTVGWYLNEPPEGEEANVAITGNFEMVARRDIEKGEELTICYDTFSDASA